MYDYLDTMIFSFISLIIIHLFEFGEHLMIAHFVADLVFAIKKSKDLPSENKEDIIQMKRKP